MNKYEEALTNIGAVFVSYKYAAVMNNYEEELIDYCHLRDHSDYKKNYESLQELVKKATPKKPFKYSYVDYTDETYDCYSCANCGHIVSEEYCPHCGGAIDWTDEDD